MKSSTNKLRVLLLDGDGRQVLPYIRSMRRAGHYVVIVCSSRLSPGYLSRYPSRRLIWPSCSDQPDLFLDVLEAFLKKHHIDVTLALGHYTSHLIAPQKNRFTPYTRIPLPDNEKFDILADKAKTMRYCMDNDIPCPMTFFPDQDDIEEIVAKVPFPAIVKPCTSVGAIGLHSFETPEELRKGILLLQAKYGKLLVQEKIPTKGGIQFRADTFLNANGKMHVCVVVAKPRFVPVTGGTSTVVYTIDRPDIEQYCRTLLEGIGWTGLADVDFMLDPRDNTPKLLESNPRCPVGIKIGFDCGIDFADLHLRFAMGEPLPDVPRPRSGVVLRNFAMELLWYFSIDRSERGSTYPPFFDFFGRNVYYQTMRMDDPLPVLGFVASSLRRYMNPEARSAKLGKELKA